MINMSNGLYTAESAGLVTKALGRPASCVLRLTGSDAGLALSSLDLEAFHLSVSRTSSSGLELPLTIDSLNLTYYPWPTLSSGTSPPRDNLVT